MLCSDCFIWRATCKVKIQEMSKLVSLRPQKYGWGETWDQNRISHVNLLQTQNLILLRNVDWAAKLHSSCYEGKSNGDPKHSNVQLPLLTLVWSHCDFFALKKCSRERSFRSIVWKWVGAVLFGWFLRLLDRNRDAYCREEMKKHGFGERTVGMGFIVKGVWVQETISWFWSKAGFPCMSE